MPMPRCGGVCGWLVRCGGCVCWGRTGWGKSVFGSGGLGDAVDLVAVSAEAVG